MARMHEIEELSGPGADVRIIRMAVPNGWWYIYYDKCSSSPNELLTSDFVPDRDAEHVLAYGAQR